MRALFGGRRRSVFGQGKELGAYRDDVRQRTERIDGLLASVADEIDALRRRDLDPDEAVGRLGAQEDLLDDEVAGLQEMMAPEELHGLHMEYEANLEPGDRQPEQERRQQYPCGGGCDRLAREHTERRGSEREADRADRCDAGAAVEGEPDQNGLECEGSARHQTEQRAGALR